MEREGERAKQEGRTVVRAFRTKEGGRSDDDDE
jgi:hypothetical protein